jgi:hypothetical protein
MQQVSSGSTDDGSDLGRGGAQFESWLGSLLKLFMVFPDLSMQML